MNSEYTVYNSKICPQGQQMRAKTKKKKKRHKTWRENVDAEPKRLLYISMLLKKYTLVSDFLYNWNLNERYIVVFCISKNHSLSQIIKLN